MRRHGVDRASAALEPPKRLPARDEAAHSGQWGATADDDPAIQIERLALWEGASEKLVQVNHPDIGWMFRDRNGDGKADSGFVGMHGKMDVIEVHPPHTIFDAPMTTSAGQTQNNTIVNWLQLLNKGRPSPAWSIPMPITTFTARAG